MQPCAESAGQFVLMQLPNVTHQELLHRLLKPRFPLYWWPICRHLSGWRRSSASESFRRASSCCNASAPPIAARLPRKYCRIAIKSRRLVEKPTASEGQRPASSSSYAMRHELPSTRLEALSRTWKISTRMTLSAFDRFTLCFRSTRPAIFLITSSDLKVVWLRILCRIAYCDGTVLATLILH